MKMGKVEKRINELRESQGGILLSLFDPEKTGPEEGAKMAKIAEENGSDIILVGGSIGAQGVYLDNLVKALKEACSLPVLLFPGNIATLTPYADATYFMYLINSKDVYWSTTAQTQGAPIVKRMGLEPIPTGYIVLEPGEAVGWISNANLIPRKKPDLAAAAALAAEYMGARLVITDSGSGPPDPAPPELIAAVRSVVTVPYFYAGGVRQPEQAYDIIKAGADGIHVGTAFEADKAAERIKKMADAIHKAGREKLGK